MHCTYLKVYDVASGEFIYYPFSDIALDCVYQHDLDSFLLLGYSRKLYAELHNIIFH